MKTRLVPLPIVFAFALSLLSCRKNDTGSPTPDPKPQKFVKQVSSSPLDFISYEYDSAGNVIKHVSQWQNGTGGLNRLNSLYEYTGGKLVKWSNQAGYAFYTYNNGKLSKSEHFYTNGKKVSTLLYAFNNTGKLTAVTEQIANPVTAGAKETKVSYQYYSNGNVSRIDFAYREELDDPFTIHFSKVYVEYDNNKNPEPDGVLGNFLPGVVLHINNPVRINNLIPDGSVDSYVRYEYTYNAAGYPDKRKQFIAIGGSEVEPVLFQYVY